MSEMDKLVGVGVVVLSMGLFIFIALWLLNYLVDKRKTAGGLE